MTDGPARGSRARRLLGALIPGALFSVARGAAFRAAMLAASLAASVAACGETPLPARPDALLVVDADAGPGGRGRVFRVTLPGGDADVFAHDDRFVDPQRLIPDGGDGWWLLDAGAERRFDVAAAPEDEPALFALDARGGVGRRLPLPTLRKPTGVVRRDDGLLILSERGAPAGSGPTTATDPAVPGAGLGRLLLVDPGTGAVVPLAADARFRAPSDVRAPSGDVVTDRVWLLDADARADEAPAGEEGVLFEVDARDGRVLRALPLAGGLSPLGLLAAEPDGWVVFDANADPRGQGRPHGALFRVRVDPPRTELLAAGHPAFRDPVRGAWLDPSTLVFADANSDPEGRGPDTAHRGQNATGGGALLTYDLQRRRVDVLSAAGAFVNPVDVVRDG